MGFQDKFLKYLMILGTHLEHLRTLEAPCSIQNRTNLESLEFWLTGVAKRVSWRLPESILELTLENLVIIVMS